MKAARSRSFSLSMSKQELKALIEGRDPQPNKKSCLHSGREVITMSGKQDNDKTAASLNGSAAISKH